jgi:hypothetical protein
LPKLLQTHGKRAAKKGGKVVTCCSLRHSLSSSPTSSFSLELADVQFLTALAWGIAALRNADDPGRVLNSRAVHQGQPRIKRGLCLALVGALELLSAADWNIITSRPKFRIMILLLQGGLVPNNSKQEQILNKMSKNAGGLCVP